MRIVHRGSLFALCGWFCLGNLAGLALAQQAQPAAANTVSTVRFEGDSTPTDESVGQAKPSERVQLVQVAQAPATPTPAAPGTPARPTLPPTDIIAEPPVVGDNYASDAVRIPSVLRGTVFASPPVNGYSAPSSSVATMIDVPNHLVPGSVNTITRDVLRDQNVLYVDDVLRDIPSAVKGYGDAGVIRPDSFFIRGFEVTSRNWRKDGYLDPTYVPRDPANIERIDILTGPSMLYGPAQPAGTFNVTTKKAQVDPFARGGFMTGSYGLQRYTFDVNNGLRDDGSLLLRINGAYQNGNSNVNSVFNERTFIAPTLTWLIDDDTSLTWSGEYQKDRFRLNNGVPAINGDPFAISRNTFVGDPNGDVADYTSYRSTLTLEHQLSDNWTARVGEMSLWYDTPSSQTIISNGSLGANGLLNSSVFGRDLNTANPFLEQNHDLLETLTGDVDGRFFRHRAVLGAEQDWFITTHDTFSQTQGGFYSPGINVANAGTFPTTPFAFGPIPTVTTDNPAFRQTRMGLFAQDVMDITPRLHLLVGGRFDYMQQTYSRSFTTINAGPFSGTTGDIYTQNEFYQFSPRVGMTYDLIPDSTALYWNYSRSFTPSVGVANLSTATLLPMYGDIWEGGVKYRVGNNFAFTTGGYYIRQTNVTVETTDPATLITTLSQAGAQTSQGVETSMTGQLTRRLSTISNFGYNDSLLYGLAQPFAGQAVPLDQSRVRGVPHWTGNAWARYNLLQNQERTIGLAVGTIYVGQRVGDYASPLILPSYNTWQTGAYYMQGRWTANLIWDNVFNVNYALSSLNQYQVIQGLPSNVRISIGATF